MKRIILSLLVAASLVGAAVPSANAVVVVVGHGRHWHHGYRRHGIYHAGFYDPGFGPGPAVVLVPGYWHGPFWHRVWVPGHYR